MAGVGEDFAFSVEATNYPPFGYQWVFNGSYLAGATRSSLVLSNITTAQAGYYWVIVGNTNGTVNSTVVTLTVDQVFPRRLFTDRMLTNSSPQVGVPIVMRANGRENAVSFSMAYKPATFANPVFLPGYANETVTTDASQPGFVGVLVHMPPGTALPAGYIPLGVLQFDLAAGANALQGGLAFSTNPVPVSATNAAQKRLHITAAVQPQQVLVTSAPSLDPQSGLFKQQIIVSNPGATVITNVNIWPVTLGYDTRTNRIRFYNGVAELPATPFNDPLVYVGWKCGCGFVVGPTTNECDFASFLTCAGAASSGLNQYSTDMNFVFAQIHNLAPAESRVLTLEYYVSDHLTTPPVRYSVWSADAVNLTLPSTLTPMNITTNRYINGTFIIEFPTVDGYHYYVQYDRNPSFTNVLTVFPPVIGTGSRVQWIDDGPPKTISPPVNGSRFYRVLQNP